MKFQKLLGVVKNERNGSFFRDRALLYFFSFSVLLSFLFNLFRRYFAFENVEDECALTRISCEADVVIKRR